MFTMAEFKAILDGIAAVQVELAGLRARFEEHCKAEEVARRPRSTVATLVAAGSALASTFVAVWALLR